MAKELTTVDDDIDIEMSDMMPVLMVAMMAMMVSFMTTVVSPMAQQLQAQSYRGLTDDRTLNATPTLQWINLISDPPYSPWISASFFNDGPNSAFIAINNPAELTEIDKGGSLEVSMAGGQRRIEFVFYKCNLGENTSVRVIGKY
jgi:hypothetical protein